MAKPIRYLKKAIKSKNKKEHIKRILFSYYYAFRSILKLKDYILLPKYFLSKQYKTNKWAFNQSLNYSSDFEEFFDKDNFYKNFDLFLSGFDENSKNELKFLIKRMMFFSILRSDNLFSRQELADWDYKQKLLKSIKMVDDHYIIEGIKFINNNFTLHNFIGDLGLKGIQYSNIINNRDIIDVGAYIGDSALILSKYTKKNVYAFEPFKSVYNEMVQNIKINNKKNIIPVKLGLSNKKGKIPLYTAGDMSSISTNDPEPSLSKGAYSEKIDIEVSTIDSFKKENNLSVGVIKIDAEGAEQKILQGSIDTINIDRPILLISIYHNVSDFFNIKPWIEGLDLGYKFKIIKPEPTTFIEETLLICFYE